MMKKPTLSAKRVAIDKTNATLIVIVAVAVFIVIFSLVAVKALYSQLTYQSRVINAKEVTLKQVQKNKDEAGQLETAYQEFAGSQENVIGGNSKGTGDRDGENSRIILDALPSRYDYPALTTSLDKLVRSGGFTLSNVEGTDDEANQAGKQSAVQPVAVEMPFSLESEMGTSDGKRFMELFEKSIRPIQVKKLKADISGGKLTLGIEAKTFYQPEKKLNVTNEVVK